jgi:hypothetical protein
LRPELAVVRTARCAAAWAKRTTVEECDLSAAWRLCLGHRHIAKTQKSRSEPPPPPADRSLPFDNRAITTARAPLESRADGKELFELVPRSRSDLSNWFVEKPKIQSSLSGHPGGRISENKATSPIAWIETLVASVRAGWSEDRKRIRLCRRTISPKEQIWCFLDASRSTGMNQFLARARDLLAGTAAFARSGKFHLLLLNRGEVRWQCRNVTFETFVNELSRLKVAGGKSLIVEALGALHRRRLAKRTSANNRVLILSDGLASPRSGEHSSDTRSRLRLIVQRLAANGALVAWIAPGPKRVLKRWLAQLLHGISIARFEI